MKSLIVTVAGTATRFNRDTNAETLKCLYTETDYKATLLYQILKKAEHYDSFIIVGGFLFDALERFVRNNLQEFADRIRLVKNDHYSDYGSGYSLQLGIRTLPEETTEVVFVEGDLFNTKDSFETVDNTETNVITVNRDYITSDKAVALYINTDGKIRYIYDTSHEALEIPESFLAIYNSAQIWKFTDVGRLFSAGCRSGEDIKGTNLVIIQNYFGDLDRDEYKIIEIDPWFNCNTVNDYRKIKNLI